MKTLTLNPDPSSTYTYNYCVGIYRFMVTTCVTHVKQQPPHLPPDVLDSVVNSSITEMAYTDSRKVMPRHRFIHVVVFMEPWYMLIALVGDVNINGNCVVILLLLNVTQFHGWKHVGTIDSARLSLTQPKLVALAGAW